MIATHLLGIATVIGSFVSLLFLLSLVLKRNDIADSAWGIGILLVAITSYLQTEAVTPLHTLLTALAALWGLRLSVRITVRNAKKTEDYRYKRWRDSWGTWFYLRSFLQVYLLQGSLMIVVGYSFIHASVFGSHTTLSTLTYVGLAVWCIGYFFEAVADWQLDRFIASKPERGVILTSGLWRYSRHPNYFGEVAMWWGIWLMIAPLPLSYIALISPLMITFLILKVSGVPLLEEKFAGNPAFEAYKKQTSVFIPLPPKST